MVDTAWGGARDADIVALLIDAAKGIDEEVQALLDRLGEIRQPKVLLLNKIDTVKRESLLALGRCRQQGGRLRPHLHDLGA